MRTSTTTCAASTASWASSRSRTTRGTVPAAQPLPQGARCRCRSFLSDEQVKALQEDFEEPGRACGQPAHRRDALLDRACFYLLWQGGMRKGEVEELRLEDVDLRPASSTVRRGKGLKDRTVYLTELAVQSVAGVPAGARDRDPPIMSFSTATRPSPRI